MKVASPSIDYARLAERMGEETLSRRLMAQTHLNAKMLSARTGWFNPDNLYGLNSVLRGCLWLTGLEKFGNRCFRDIQVYHHEVFFDSLPTEFDGFTILQLSDLHLEENSGVSEAIIEAVSGVQDYDLCALTGDYRFKMIGPFGPCMKEMETILQAIEAPVYAVLGNHDEIEMTPALEGFGARVLLNETVAIERGGQLIHLLGVDDPHYYRTDDIRNSLAPHEAWNNENPWVDKKDKFPITGVLEENPL